MPTNPPHFEVDRVTAHASAVGWPSGRPRQTRVRRPPNTIHAAPDVVQKLQLRRLNFRPHWEDLQLGETTSLAMDLDRLIDEGVPPDIINRHLDVTSRQYGVPGRVASRLLEQRLSRLHRRRLADRTSRLVRVGKATITDRRSRLNAISERSRKAVFHGLRVRDRRLQKLRKRMVDAWRAMPDKARDALRSGTTVFRFRHKFECADHRLVARWLGDRFHSNKKERQRLEAARHAEKAALAYYRGLGNDVEDVSIQELEGTHRDWTNFDLRADGRPLDVKNVRCSREDRFAEHYWKKQKRDGSLDIPIVGVVTMEDTGCSIVTGELLPRDLTRFRELINTYGRGPQVSAEPRDWSTFVPGWLLDYPSGHYESMPDWADVTRRWLEIADEIGTDVPRWILGLAASRLPELQHRAFKTPVLHTAQQYFLYFGLSRRTVFWFVFVFMFSHLRSPRAASELIGHLFADGAKDFPLGLSDPRKYVWSLIHTLNQMIETNRDLLQSVSHIRLSGFAILQARVVGQWLTILAYCGNCGKWPIFLGRTDATAQHDRPGTGSCRRGEDLELTSSTTSK